MVGITPLQSHVDGLTEGSAILAQTVGVIIGVSTVVNLATAFLTAEELMQTKID